MLDRSGRVTTWNSGAQRIEGYEAAEIVGQHFSCFFTPEDRAADVPTDVLRAAASEDHHEVEYLQIRKNATLYRAHVVLNVVPRTYGGVLLGFARIVRDITAQYTARLELEEAQRRFVHAQKMEAIGQLTGGVAHDFNNLLQAAAGNLDLAQSAVRRGETERADRLLSNAARALGRGSQLTAQLLSFSQRQILRAERVHLSALVTEMVELLRITTPGAVTLRTQSAEALWPVYLDAAQFSSAILNLVINSRDAMPNGGEIAIELCNVTLSKSQAAVMELAWGDYVRVDVADTGTGMTPEIAEHEIEPFFTTNYAVAAQASDCRR